MHINARSGFCCLKLNIYYSLLIFGGYAEVCVVLYREEFRKQFKKENPENKAVSAVSVDYRCCVTVITLHEIRGQLFSCMTFYLHFTGGQSCWS